MLKIGLTGGIGSGKSVVAKILKSMGYPVFDSDSVAKEIMLESPEAKRLLIGSFGKDVYRNGHLNKPFLRAILFDNEANRIKINEIVHPLVRNAFEEFCQSNTNHSLVFNESALLFETSSTQRFDHIILVTAPKSVRTQRVVQRDGVSAEDVEKRMDSQWRDEKKVTLTEFIISNDGENPLLAEVESIIEKILN
jgi:dephospho-CoA kinase